MGGMGIHMHVRLLDMSKRKDEDIVDEWDTEDWEPDSDPQPTYEVDGITWKTNSSSMVQGQWITDVQVKRA
jgi:hypothetical protein